MSDNRMIIEAQITLNEEEMAPFLVMLVLYITWRCFFRFGANIPVCDVGGKDWILQIRLDLESRLFRLERGESTFRPSVKVSLPHPQRMEPTADRNQADGARFLYL